MNIAALQLLVTGAIPAKAGVRRPHQFWVPYAWGVRALVEEGGMSVSAATRAILNNSTENVTPENLNCLRVVYYKIREKEWPPEARECVKNYCAAVTDEPLEEETITDEPEREQTITEAPETVTNVAEREQPTMSVIDPTEEAVVIDPTEEADDGYIPDEKEFEV